ncbi:MAG TPA: hypothetical protein VF447_14250 [Terriglobales bacterium]
MPTNGNIGLLANMEKRVSPLWDCILSAEDFPKYKPEPAVYLGFWESRAYEYASSIRTKS